VNPVAHVRGGTVAGLLPGWLEESVFMEWRVVSERPLYNDEWLDIRIADVELPDGRHLDHRSIHTHPGAGAVVIDSERRVLLIWRHRFITGTWAWEIPVGKIEECESPADAAAREFEEETGWRPGPLRHMIYVQPTPGISTSEHHIYRADEAEYIGNPADSFESERVAWVPLAEVRSLIDKAEIVSGTTLAALLYVLSEQ
jgi:8-oxo-dGTP pyrophosphatase MutT (NUDIX family)